jgi:hypothetical protein
MPLQGPIQSSFQFPSTHRYAVFADLSLRVTIAQPQRLLQDGLYGARELRFPFSRHQDHFPTTPQQMRQAALVQRLDKLI